ncbi:MAG: FliI/YscN family ATPase [Planctomycetota bacterium]
MRALSNLHSAIAGQDLVTVSGRVRRVNGLVIEADGLPLAIGSQCRVLCRQLAGQSLEAEVVAFRDQRTVLLPCGPTAGVSPGDAVLYEGEQPGVGVGQELLGRILDARGQPIDGKGPIRCIERLRLDSPPIPPLGRQRIHRPMSTGVRAIDSLLTCGCGQRVGVFSGSGVGKSVLLGMLARYSAARVNVIALVGERGREVREFVERDLGPIGLSRSVVVTATSDESPVMRLRAARVATRIAEWFRDSGVDVTFLLDSITRVALAQREVGLSASEPPATRAFPPSVFTLLAQLLERTGPAELGSITGFYTVLVEGDDLHDPIGDAVRGILDGHIWLSRKLATRGFFPAIDVLESVSRVMKDVVTTEHLEFAREAVADLARARDVEDLIHLGAYVRGTDPRTDLAVDRVGRIEALLRQTPDESASLEQAAAQLKAIYQPAKSTKRETAP